jgi:hypothetical protein
MVVTKGDSMVEHWVDSTVGRRVAEKADLSVDS